MDEEECGLIGDDRKREKERERANVHLLHLSAIKIYQNALRTAIARSPAGVIMGKEEEEDPLMNALRSLLLHRNGAANFHREVTTKTFFSITYCCFHTYVGRESITAYWRHSNMRMRGKNGLGFTFLFLGVK